MATAPARERLIEAAFDLFGERGYDETTVDDIAERAGVSRMTFFRAFRAKEEVIFPDHAEILEAIRARFAVASPDTAEVAVADAARHVLQHYLDEGDLARRRYALTRSVPALADRERASIRQYERLFADFIAQARPGDPSGLHAELLANAIVTAHNHVLRRWLRGESTDPEAEFTAAMAEVLARFGSAAGEASAADDHEAAVLVIRSRRDLDAALPGIRRLLQ